MFKGLGGGLKGVTGGLGGLGGKLGIKRKGTSIRYRFDVHIEKLEDVPAKVPLVQIEWSRHSKIQVRGCFLTALAVDSRVGYLCGY